MNRAWYLKIFFVFLAVLFTVLLFTTGEDERLNHAPKNEQEEAPKIHTEDDLTEAVEGTTMLSPRYTGEDNVGRSWDIAADRATHVDGTNKTDIGLFVIRGLLDLKTGGNIQIHANEGHFNPLTQELGLLGNVTIIGYGHTLKTAALTGNIKTREAHSTDPITLTGLGFVFKAESFKTLNNAKELNFQKVRITINPANWQNPEGGFFQ